MKHIAVICDLDGTLCNVSHRRHFIASKPKNWKAWNAGISKDTVNIAVLALINSMYLEGYDIILCSGRGSENRAVTEKWLQNNSVFCYNALYMRKEGDYRQDDVVKAELYEQILQDGYKPFMAIEDRKSVKKLWVSKGLFVFDVNQEDIVF